MEIDIGQLTARLFKETDPYGNRRSTSRSAKVLAEVFNPLDIKDVTLIMGISMVRGENGLNYHKEDWVESEKIEDLQVICYRVEITWNNRTRLYKTHQSLKSIVNKQLPWQLHMHENEEAAGTSLTKESKRLRGELDAMLAEKHRWQNRQHAKNNF